MSCESLDKLIFSNMGKFQENLFSERHNKYYFRLLQIFGFREESLLSFIDKDHMKNEYLKAYEKKKFAEKRFLEHFMISYGLRNLYKFRDQNFRNV